LRVIQFLGGKPTGMKYTPRIYPEVEKRRINRKESLHAVLRDRISRLKGE